MKKLIAIVAFVLLVITLGLGIDVRMLPRGIDFTLLNAEHRVRYKDYDVSDIALNDKFGEVRLIGNIAKPDETVILAFWASWCRICAREFPLMDQFAAGIAGEPIRVIAINSDSNDDWQTMEGFFKQLDIRYVETYRDFSGDFARKVDLYGYPSFFLVRDGKVVAGTRPDWADADTLKQLLLLYAGDSQV